MLKYCLCMLVSVILTLIFINPLKAEAFDVSAASAVMIEASTGDVVYEKNAYEQRSMASTTKIMTTLLCLESGNLDDSFIVDENAIMVEGSSMGLVKGDVVTKRALCCGMMLPSGNDAANATAVKLADSIGAFSDMMNERAEKIGMKNTHFVTPSGLEADGEHYSTAYDMALLTREALKNEEFRRICGSSSIKVKFGNPPYERTLFNTNKLLNMYDGVIGVKTGFTDEAGRCLVSACERDGITLICVTLNAPDDWNDHMKMYDYGFLSTDLRVCPTDSIMDIDVVGSDKNSIRTSAANELTYGGISGKQYDITVKYSMNPFVYAPVCVGDIIGRADYYCNGVFIGSVDVLSAENADLIKVER
ncbi:MAG: D-alanyl-D-alanine carboxypeptidase family protein, partial [Oscillospiraceae bacterium]